MKPLDKAGFTIIETMLFLGITALLVMGVLVGAGTSINIQRYRDSVSSLQSVLQQQYSDALYVDNDRGSDWACDADGVSDTGGVIARGQSDCVILGRYITTPDSHSLSIRSVVGYIPDNSFSNDVEALREYDIKISSVSNETYEIEWGSSLMKPGGDNDMRFSMLVLRSPSSGILRTFIDPDEVIGEKEVSTLVTDAALKQPAKMCIDSSVLFGLVDTVRIRTAILVNANAANASGVEVLEEATSEC